MLAASILEYRPRHMLQRKFNFTYVGADDERECHVFENGQYTLTVFPVYYYENQGEIRIANMYIM